MQRNNFGQLIKAEMVKRFENVVTEEVRQHNLAIHKYQNDLKELRISFENIIDKQETLKKETSKIYSSSQDNFFSEMKRLEIDFEEHRKYIYESRRVVESNILDFDDRLSDSISSEEFKKFLIQINERFNTLYKTIETEKKENSEKIEHLNLNISKTLKDITESNNNLSNKVEDPIKELSKKLETYVVDATGIHREIVVFRKDVMVMERKIEHFYLLIEELKKNKE